MLIRRLVYLQNQEVKHEDYNVSVDIEFITRCLILQNVNPKPNNTETKLEIDAVQITNCREVRGWVNYTRVNSTARVINDTEDQSGYLGWTVVHVIFSINHRNKSVASQFKEHFKSQAFWVF